MSESNNPYGRPLTVSSPDEFQARADEYFLNCEVKDKVPTVNGLALALGFNSRQSLLNYADKPEFLDTVKTVRARLENEWEQRLSGPNAAGTIFWLKNQGWSDRNEQVISNPDGSGLFSGIEVNLVRRTQD